MASILSKSLKEIDEMEADEVLLWQEWMSSEPRGMRRMDFHAAQITQAIYGIMNRFTAGSKPVRLKDCLLTFKTREADNQQDNLKNAIVLLAAFGGKNKISSLEKDLRKHYGKVDSESNGNSLEED